MSTLCQSTHKFLSVALHFGEAFCLREAMGGKEEERGGRVGREKSRERSNIMLYQQKKASWQKLCSSSEKGDAKKCSHPYPRNSTLYLQWWIWGWGIPGASNPFCFLTPSISANVWEWEHDLPMSSTTDRIGWKDRLPVLSPSTCVAL